MINLMEHRECDTSSSLAIPEISPWRESINTLKLSFIGFGESSAFSRSRGLLLCYAFLFPRCVPHVVPTTLSFELPAGTGIQTKQIIVLRANHRPCTSVINTFDSCTIISLSAYALYIFYSLYDYPLYIFCTCLPVASHRHE